MPMINQATMPCLWLIKQRSLDFLYVNIWLFNQTIELDIYSYGFLRDTDFFTYNFGHMQYGLDLVMWVFFKIWDMVSQSVRLIVLWLWPIKFG